MGNLHRDRSSALNFVRTWDDYMFKRQFRLCREDFKIILEGIAPLIGRNEDMAARSSGSSVGPELKLMFTLRFCAGARHLDLIWSVSSICRPRDQLHMGLLESNKCYCQKY